MASVARLETSKSRGKICFTGSFFARNSSSLSLELTFMVLGLINNILRDLVSYYGLEGKVFFGDNVADVK